MKKTLLLIASGIAFSVNAQIVHTDLTPDSIVSSNYDLDIDLDNNNVDDYRFHGEVVAGPPSSEFTFIEAGGVGSSNYTLNSSATELSVLNFGDTINSGATIWQQLTSTNAVMTTYVLASPVAGLWPNQSDKFIGVQFLISSNYHFGWIKLSTDATTNQITVKEYAYNTTSGQQILAGQTVITGTGVSENVSNQVKIFQSGAVLSINTIENVYASYSLCDLSGKVVASAQISDSKESLNVTDLTTGFYLITLIGKNEQLVQHQKLYIQR
ncbi:MAG: hypothetical protein ACI9J3_003329 [Parvicellaceae bacterium]|jgi:hypothetical protein